jgi:hypothetical protein
MKDVLRALARSETVQITYHGKVKGEIVPRGSNPVTGSSEHPMFGMLKREKDDPGEMVSAMRRSRRRDL